MFNKAKPDRKSFVLSLVRAGFLATFGAATALAQGYYPDPYDYGAAHGGDYAPDDPYLEFDRPQRAPPRPNGPEARDALDGEFEPEGAAPSRRTRRPAAPLAALPPDADPAYSTPLDLDADVDSGVSTKALVDDPTGQPAGTITIDTRARKLYLTLGQGQAYEYGVGVGRQGFAWKGQATVGRKAYWPGWTPPKEMRLRRPDLPEHMAGGIDNPLGARALYLFKGAKDTLFRIHGTNEPDTIGQAVSSGCIRMLNADIIDLYGRVPRGARVSVL